MSLMGDLATKLGGEFKAHRLKIESLENNKLDIQNIQDDLISNYTNKPLSAKQGKVLKGLIDNINTLLTSNDASLDTVQELVDFIKINRTTLNALSITSIAGLQNALNAKEPTISAGTTGQYLRGDKTWATMPTSLPASDVYSWAKASTKPSYSYGEVGSPSTTGANASGTWGINISGSSASCSGNSATATTATNQTAGSGVTCDAKFKNTPAHGTSFSECNGQTDAPNTGWWFIYSIRHSNASNYWGTQIAYGWEDNANAIYERNISGGTWSGWTRVDVSGANITEIINNAGYITSAGRAYPRRSDGGDLNFIWSGQGGQPTWLWGGTDGSNMYVYNPSNFSVNYATTAGNGGVTSVNGMTGAVTVSTSGITLGTTVATTSGTAIDFTGILSTAKRITIMLKDVTTSLANGGLCIRLGSGTIQTTGYVGGSISILGGGNSNTLKLTSGIPIISLDPSTDRMHGSIVLAHMGGNVWTAQGALINNNSSYSYPMSISAGTVALTGAIDRLRLTNVNAVAFTAGSMNIMYEV